MAFGSLTLAKFFVLTGGRAPRKSAAWLQCGAVLPKVPAQ